MAYTKSQGMATMRYQEKALERLYISVKKGKKSEYASHAKAMGESLQAFVHRAMDEAMMRDKEKDT